MHVVSQAFSHWTHHITQGEVLVVDIQGIVRRHEDGTSTYVLTDPQVRSVMMIGGKDHGRERSSVLKCAVCHGWMVDGWMEQVQCPDKTRFGRGNCGDSGAITFFRAHVCNHHCVRLGLRRPGDLTLLEIRACPPPMIIPPPIQVSLNQNKGPLSAVGEPWRPGVLMSKPHWVPDYEVSRCQVRGSQDEAGSGSSFCLDVLWFDG